MTDSLRCSSCGLTLDVSGPMGLCAACLVNLGLASGATTNVEREDNASPPALPRFVGPYRILATLGEGGMGVVYLAEQAAPLQRRVALKVIRLGMDTREVVARFEAERQALALMEHPKIASVFDAGATEDGRPYFVMEYVPGVPITSYCDEQRLSTSARLTLFTEVCSAIQHAHQKGVVHRDLKPSNVLVMMQDGRPVPKVIDFGIAKAMHQRLTERTLFTQHGQFIGTPEYMSPEQAEMGALDVDATTDIYSLGVLLYELLVGGLPFEPTRLRQAGYAEIQRIIREEEPARPSTKLTSLGAKASDVASRHQTSVRLLARELTGDLDWITLRALEKDRTRRYASASELAADIARHLADEPVVARPPSMAYRLRKLARRRRGAVIAAGLVAAAIVAGLVVSTALYFRSEAARQEAGHDAYLASISAAYGDLRGTEANSYNLFRVSSPSERARHHLFLADASLRNWEWRYLFAKSNSSLATMWGRENAHRVQLTSPIYWPVSTGGPSAAVSVGIRDLPFAISPDGRQLWWKTDFGSADNWNLEEPGPAQVIKVPVTQRLIAIDSAGRLIATTSINEPQHIMILDLATGRELSRVGSRVSRTVQAAFAKRAGILATVGVDNSIRLWKVDDGTLIRDLRMSPDGVSCLRVSPDGTRLVFKTDSSFAWFDASRQSVRRLSADGTWGTCAEFSPDGTVLAAAAIDSVRLWDLRSDSSLGQVLSAAGPVKSVAFGPEGALIAAGQAGGIIQIWNRRHLKAGTNPVPIATLLGHDDTAVTSLSFTADGLRLISGSESREVLTWDVPRIRLAAGFDFDRAPGEGPVAVSGNGTIAATTGPPDVVEIWDLERLDISIRLTAAGHSLTSLAFADDGTRLAAGTTDGEVLLWRDLRSTPVLLRRASDTSRQNDSVGQLTFSHDGAALAARMISKELLAWDVGTGHVVFKANSALSTLQFDATGRRIMAAGGSGLGVDRSSPAVEVWDLPTGKRTLQLDRACPDAAAFSPDNKMVVMLGSCGPTLQAADATTGQIIGQSSALGFAGASLAFNSDGSRLVASSDRDGALILFDGTTWELVASLREAPAPIGITRFSTDGNRILAASRIGNGVSVLDSRSSYHPDVQLLLSRLFLEEGLADHIGAASDVLVRLAAETGIPESVRSRAIAAVEARGDRNSDALYLGSLETVRRAGQSKAAYAKALRMAEACLRLRPEKADVLALRGAAQYRLGQRPEALDTFREASAKANAPAALIAGFRSMALRDMGRMDEAMAELDRLRAFMRRADHSSEPVLQALLAEAELSMGITSVRRK